MEQTIDSDTAKSIVLRHIKAFQENNLEDVLSDYTNASVLITANNTFTGVEQIKTFFTNLIAHFPKNRSGFALEKLVADNELVFIVWSASTPTVRVPLGTDTFIIDNGKISRQTFAGWLDFLS